MPTKNGHHIFFFSVQMATFKETHEILLTNYSSNIIVFEEYALVFEETLQTTWIVHTITTGYQ